MKQHWNLQDAWNAAAISEDRNPQPRNYLYASEIFGSKIDRYFKMLGEPFTDPPNDRSKRKFFAGHVWEYIVKQVLLVCGIYHYEEIKIDEQPIPELLEVHGRLDFVAGGFVDKERALHNLEAQHLPEVLHGLAKKIINSMAGMDLETYILEIKSVSMFVYDMIEKKRRSLDYHIGQAYHYQRHSDHLAQICYISKDTCLLQQFGIDVKPTEEAYMKDIVQMSYYYMKREVPPPEPLMGFDSLLAKFSKNIKVEYSPYLSKIYGFSSPDDYRRNIEPKVKQFNNVLTRYAKIELGHLTPTGKEMKISPQNRDVKEQIERDGYNFSDLLEIKMANIGDETDDED